MKSFTKIVLLFILAFFYIDATSQTLPILPDPDYTNNHDAQITGIVTVGGTQPVAGIVARLLRVVPGSPNTYFNVSNAISDANGEFTLKGISDVSYVIDYEYPVSGFTAQNANPSAAFIASSQTVAPNGGLTLVRNVNTITNCNVSIPTLTPFANQSIIVNKAIPVNPSAVPSSVQVFSSSLVSNPSIVVSATTSAQIQKLIIGASVKIGNPFTAATLSNLVTTKVFANDEDENAGNQNPIDITAEQPLSYYDITSARTSTTNIANFSPNYIGAGTITFPISATASKTISNSGGNTSSSEITSAMGGVCLISTYTQNPLPVTLSSFTAKAESAELNKSVVLKWSTTQETNSDRFDIQRSSDAKEWNTIGEMLTGKESSELKNYQFTDSAPNNNTNYYRLKMIDKDGTYAYSRIQTIIFEENDLAVTVYPNPVSNVLFLKDISAQTVKQVTLINSNGQFAFQSDNVSFTDGINIGALSNGIYVVKVLRTDGTLNTKKIVIRH